MQIDESILIKGHYICKHMVKFYSCFLFFGMLFLMGMKPTPEEVKLECVKRQHATHTCHYNFTVNGIPYHYIDNGCKATKEDVIKRAESGKLGLARDWKIECKAKNTKND